MVRCCRGAERRGFTVVEITVAFASGLLLLEPSSVTLSGTVVTMYVLSDPAPAIGAMLPISITRISTVSVSSPP